MSVCAELRVLFRAAAGPRRGYGHLVRCRSLARALGVRPLLSIRGPEHSTDIALSFACDVVRGPAPRLLRSLAPDVLIVDDPDATAAARWINEARRAGVVVASIHDLGIGCLDADLVIDGSVIQPLTSYSRRTLRRAARGPSFAIVDPSLKRAARSVRRRRGVVVSLGGGPRADIAWSIATEIARRAPSVAVRVIGGFVSAGPPRGAAHHRPPNVIWVGPSTNLARELGSARVAVVGGGVSLYEACALGTPAVGVPVVPAQRATVAGFVARGAALGEARSALAERVADDALKLLRHERLRKFIARAARRLVDGRGAIRAAELIAELARER
jgi:spore coat polysaccharide biosynthesis predicted glycosyltransferase SpsG